MIIKYFIGLCSVMLTLLFYYLYIQFYPFFLVLFVISLIISLTFILILIYNLRKDIKALIFLKIIFLLFYIYLIASFVFIPVADFRYWRSIKRDEMKAMLDFKINFQKFSHTNCLLPTSHNWQNVFSRHQKKELYQNKPFQIVQVNSIESNFAFNSSISNKPIDSLDFNTVLLFEADGPENLSGRMKLLENPTLKDRIIKSKKVIFRYITFVDGTIAKYRLHDGSVSLFKPDDDFDYSSMYDYEEYFTEYYPPGQTPYSPLKWE